MIKNNNTTPELISLRYYPNRLTNVKTTESSLKVPFCNDRQFPSVFARVSKPNFSANWIRQTTVIVPTLRQHLLRPFVHSGDSIQYS